MDAQLRKGVLELCVLAALREGESYGYQIIKNISQYIDISESTLYPILRRLETSGQVDSYQTPHNNRLRKYYRLTESGYEALAAFAEEKEKLIGVLNFITGGAEQ